MSKLQHILVDFFLQCLQRKCYNICVWVNVEFLHKKETQKTGIPGGDNKMNDFFTSVADCGLLQDTFELLGLESHTLVLTNDELRVTAMTESAKSLLGPCVLRSVAELLSDGVADALRTCVRERVGAELSETIDDAPYLIHARAYPYGLLLKIEPAFDIYRTALEDFQTQRIRASLSSLLIAAEKLSTTPDTAEAKPLAEVVRRHGLAIHRMLLHADALTAPAAALSPDLVENDLAALCGEIAAHMSTQENIAIKILTDLPATCPAIYDERQITQAICNLLTNAAAAPEVKNITLRLTRADGEIFISVVDDGRGLPGGTLPRLYDGWRTLQTSESALSEQAEGISWGLGLPLVHRIAGAHGGMLLWSPNLPHGCTFTICLPERLRAPYPITQAPMHIRDGFNVTDVELSVL